MLPSARVPTSPIPRPRHAGAARKLVQSRGNYSTWAKRRQQQQLTHERDMQHKAEMIKQLRGFDIGKLGSTPKAMKMRKSKEKQAEKLELEAEEMAADALCLQEDAETPLSLKAGGELGAGSTAVQIKDVGFRYDASLPLLFRNAEMGIDSQSRIVLLGENGESGGIGYRA